LPPNAWNSTAAQDDTRHNNIEHVFQRSHPHATPQLPPSAHPHALQLKRRDLASSCIGSRATAARRVEGDGVSGRSFGSAAPTRISRVFYIESGRFSYLQRRQVCAPLCATSPE
jgi:hypothetical protein